MDEVRDDGRHRGWADRVADALSARAGDSGFEYANLAIRGRLVRGVIDEQVPAAVALGPDLASLAVGVNDTLRPSYDVHRAATAMEEGVRALRGCGADVVVFAFGDPSRRSRVMAPVRERIRAYNSAVRDIARHYRCFLVDFWQVAAYDDPALWDEDWLHLSPLGHEITSRFVLDTLGLGEDSWRTPIVPAPRPGLPRRAAAGARWAGRHLAPWVGRRIRGESSGDAVQPKDPRWVSWAPPGTMRRSPAGEGGDGG